MKILIALNDNQGMESKLSEHFGHCPFFAVYESETKKLEIIKNSIDHAHTLSPVEQITKLELDTVFTLGIGNRAITLFSEKGIKLKTGNYTKLGQVIDNINNLKDLGGGCDH